jgi:hypothetical protein
VRRWRVRYRDQDDPGCPVFSCVIKGYDRDHVIERFLDAPDGEGWQIISIDPI